MKIDTDKEPCFFEEFRAEDMENIIGTQHKITEYSKKHKFKKLFSILWIIDDISDDPRVSRHNKLLNSLYVRGRHNSISIITSVQKASTVPPIIRVNATHWFFFKVRNFKEIEMLQDELSAVVRRNNLHESKQMIYKLYKIATAEPDNFIYINRLEKDPQKMFLINLTSFYKLKIDSVNLEFLDAFNKNREEQLAKCKKYYQDNIEERRKIRNRLCQCSCGDTYTYANKTRHYKSTKHQQYLQTIDKQD